MKKHKKTLQSSKTEDHHTEKYGKYFIYINSSLSPEQLGTGGWGGVFPSEEFLPIGKRRTGGPQKVSPLWSLVAFALKVSQIFTKADPSCQSCLESQLIH